MHGASLDSSESMPVLAHPILYVKYQENLNAGWISGRPKNSIIMARDKKRLMKIFEGSTGACLCVWLQSGNGSIVHFTLDALTV